MTTFRQLLEEFDASAKTTAAKGRRFEEFCLDYFQTDPIWKERFDAVWPWMDWPGRESEADAGVDLVAREKGTDDLVAIQCKFYSPTASLSWTGVSTFVGMLGRPEFTSGMIVSTAGSESPKVEVNLERHAKATTIWRVDDFERSAIDWDQFTLSSPSQLRIRPPLTLRPHQEAAIAEVVAGFEESDRGQLIMACGTGKTLTSLRLAEQVVGAGGSVLFLVPSINLLSQSVKAWANDATIPLATFAVCSDAHAGARRREDEDMSANDLSVPASTNTEALLEAIDARASDTNMSVVFSTYQSIDVISKAQADGIGQFDLVICDEAHRTTGAFTDIDDQSMFTKVHFDEYVKTAKRLYMTATPRVYGDQAKAKAADADVLVASMDDESTFGPVFHELRFGDAVAQRLLTDYKVLVLAVNEDEVSSAFQRQLASTSGELALNDVSRIVGCWHALSKRGPQFEGDNHPMRRAVAFSSTIKQSKAFTEAFPEIANEALEERAHRNAVKIEAQHVDGKTNVKVRSEAVAWLEEPPGQGVCRVLSNAKCLTEGVDVPALDAVLFLQPRKSIVDVVQAVGRVMRLAPDKEFGYVVLPVAIPAGVAPEDALRNQKDYQVVWQVLQALRSHDERLAAEINKIDINKTSSKVEVIGIGLGNGGDDPANPGEKITTPTTQSAGTQLELPDLHEWHDAIYARIVEKVGNRRYMESWAADIAQIASAQETRIRTLLDHPDQNPQAVARFDEFLTALRNNLNDGVSRDDAIGMLSQHLITRPVFEALFGGDQFTLNNPVSQVMQSMIDTLDDANLQSETATLEGFYEHIRMLIGGITTAEARQKVITELYEKFFKRALPQTVEALGIVYTPIEIVDFINRSVNDLLQKHFDGTTLSDEGVHVLDPFTGTGTFITRLLQTGLINPADLARKYASELHANEIMLLAYYIAAINIETTYNTLTNKGGYEPFEGIVLTDTFQLAEEGDPMDAVFFPSNNARADHQKGLDIRVILGNPPYSVGQTSQNDNNQNLGYPTLDKSIADTYAKLSTATLKNSLYDSYIRAIRWASNRIHDSPDGGIIGFVSNGGWIDGNTADGIRLSLPDEFHHIYIYNLRGNTRTSGEQARKEGGQTFGPGSRNTIAITLLVKQPDPVPDGGAQIHYRDIGDYLTRETKLATIETATVANLTWDSVEPNEAGDWVNQRDSTYDQLVPLTGPDGIFSLGSRGLITSRDAWAYNSSKVATAINVERMIDHYNAQVEGFQEAVAAGEAVPDTKSAASWVDRDPLKYSWDRGDFPRLAKGQLYALEPTMLRESLYRPFFRQWVAFDRTLNNETYQLPRLYPTPETHNYGISIVTHGSKQPFSATATNTIPCLHLIGSDTTAFLGRWRYEQRSNEPTLLDDPTDGTWTRSSNLNAAAIGRFQTELGDDITDDAVFYYVYGALHSPEFRQRYKSNLKKEAPRVPMPPDWAVFDAYSNAGAELMELHIGYETIEPYPLEEHWSQGADPGVNPKVLRVGDKKMRYPKVTDPETGTKVTDRTQLIYNPHLTLSGIPERAHDYKLGTRSAIDWIIDRYYIKTDKASGIVNDPNAWADEHNQPRYILDLVGRVITLSLSTLDIIDELPPLLDATPAALEKRS
nr:type ISP restriction/modification enzyme [uncultured Candidatus Microthrix sp.]